MTHGDQARRKEGPREEKDRCEEDNQEVLRLQVGGFRRFGRSGWLLLLVQPVLPEGRKTRQGLSVFEAVGCHLAGDEVVEVADWESFDTNRSPVELI